MVDLIDVFKNRQGLAVSLGDQQVLGTFWQESEGDRRDDCRDRTDAGKHAPGDVGIAVEAVDHAGNDDPSKT